MEFNLCVFPISGNYAPLQRLHFYLVLLFAATGGGFGKISAQGEGRGRAWLVGGAFAAAMSTAGVAAVHAVILLVIAPRVASTSSRPALLDLDAAGIWALLVPSALLLAPMLSWNPALRTSVAARRILRVWGLLVSVGAACSFAVLIQVYMAESFNASCTAAARNPLRVGETPTTTTRGSIFDKRFRSALPVDITALVLIVLVTLPACLLPDTSRLANSSWDSESLPSALGGTRGSRLCGWGAAACVVVTAVFVGLGERWVLDLPVSSDVWTVGQWSVWVATALVVGAGLVMGAGTGSDDDQGKRVGETLVRVVV
jgi:hypothetical protein